MWNHHPNTSDHVNSPCVICDVYGHRNSGRQRSADGSFSRATTGEKPAEAKTNGNGARFPCNRQRWNGGGLSAGAHRARIPNVIYMKQMLPRFCCKLTDYLDRRNKHCVHKNDGDWLKILQCYESVKYKTKPTHSWSDSAWSVLLVHTSASYSVHDQIFCENSYWIILFINTYI